MTKKKITKVYERLITLGADENTSSSQLKKIKLFNAFCLVWYLVALSLVFFETPDYNYFFNTANLIHFVYMTLVFIIQILHKKKHYQISYLLFIGLLFSIVFIFANYVIKGEFLEYYYITLPCLSLIFISNKYRNYSVLLISVLCFYVPNLIFEYYPTRIFNNIVQPLLIVQVFIVTNYLNTVNAKNEKALEAKTHELEKLNNFKSQFFTNISHEIRTPLTLIKGQNEKLKGNLTENQVIDIKNAVNSQITKITEIVDDVLDLAKLETSEFKLNLKENNITTIAKKLYLGFEPLFKEKKIDFSFNTIHKNYYAKIDLLLIERALNNILINAYKYTDANGKVSLELKREKNNILITIKDTGIGITEKDAKNIFNRFYQVNNDINKAGGSGVGLAFSKEIIELHNGKLTVRSKINEGSSFRIVLPLIREKSITETQTTNSKPIKNIALNLTALTGKTFLIVDDTIDMRNYLKSILINYKCLEATNGLQALEIINKNHVDFIITDYMMPKMDGLEFITSFKNKGNNTPIIMLTAKADYSSKINVLKLGIDDYMIKPFEQEELLIRIKNALTNYKNAIEYNEETDKEEAENTITETSLLEKINQYILDNSTNSKLNQDEISETFNISKSSLYRKIKSETGLSPNEFITEIKLQKARRMLENNKKTSIKTLALEVGFAHTSYFSKIYKKRFGKTALQKTI